MHVVKVKLGLIGIIAFFRRGEKRQINKRPIQYLDFQHAAQFSPGINYDWTGIGLIVGQGLSDRLQIIRLDNKINMTEVSIIIILVQLGVNKIRRGTQTHNICGSIKPSFAPWELCAFLTTSHKNMRSHKVPHRHISQHTWRLSDCRQCGSQMEAWITCEKQSSWKAPRNLLLLFLCFPHIWWWQHCRLYIYLYIHTHAITIKTVESKQSKLHVSHKKVHVAWKERGFEG